MNKWILFQLQYPKNSKLYQKPEETRRKSVEPSFECACSSKLNLNPFFWPFHYFIRNPKKKDEIEQNPLKTNGKHALFQKFSFPSVARAV